MKAALHRGVALLALVASVAAHAQFLRPDPTGLWFDPAQPGWGLEVAQQGDTAFAVLFTYDSNHNPTWYVASNLSNSIDFNELPAVMKGTLYRTTGPAFSASSFDPHAVGVTAVGTLAITYSFGQLPRTLALNYTIDGTQYSRNLTPQTWSSSAQDLIGDYGGQLFLGLINGGDTPPNCPPGNTVASPPSQPFQPYTFSVAATDAPDRVKILWGSGVDIGCAIDAKYTRAGQLASLSGNLACGPIGNPLPAPGDPISIDAIASTGSGFSGVAGLNLSLPGGGLCRYSGTFGGVLRRAPSTIPDRTGVWYDPSEPGWGLILTEQGTNVFAALFAYGTDNQPTWWVASNVISGGDFPGLGALFSGTLYRTSGPYFGTADTTPLSATPVGSLQILGPSDTGTLGLMYSVNGVTVTKTVTRESWSSNRAFLTGSFTGGLFPSPGSGCTSDLFAATPVTFTTSMNSLDPLTFSWTGASGASCTTSPTYVQTGQFASLSGLVQCNGAAAGELTIHDASVTETGFHGTATFAFGDCRAFGFVGGVRR